MNYETLISGYKQILNTIYSPKQYYERVRTFLKEYRPRRKRKLSLQFNHVKGFIQTVWFLGIKDKGRKYYWKLLMSSLFKHPQTLHLSLSFAVYGFHFRKVIENYINRPMEDVLKFRMIQKNGGY